MNSNARLICWKVPITLAPRKYKFLTFVRTEPHGRDRGKIVLTWSPRKKPMPVRWLFMINVSPLTVLNRP